MVNEIPLQILRVVPHNSLHASGGLARNWRSSGHDLGFPFGAASPEPLHSGRRMIFALVAQRATETNVALASRSWPGVDLLILTPEEALGAPAAG